MHESHKVQVFVKSFISSRQKQPFAQFVTQEEITIQILILKEVRALHVKLIKKLKAKKQGNVGRM